MKIKEGLTKENFWNEMKQKYPDTMAHFCRWIDEYKKEIQFNELFLNGIRVEQCRIKFHDLPYAMQLGIWLEYVSQSGKKLNYSFPAFDLKTSIEFFMREHEKGFMNESL